MCLLTITLLKKLVIKTSQNFETHSKAVATLQSQKQLNSLNRLPKETQQSIYVLL